MSNSATSKPRKLGEIGNYFTSGAAMSRLTLVPISLREGHKFVYLVHRHHKPARGGKFPIAEVGPGLRMAIIGVAIVGRPVSRIHDDGWTAEFTRLATDGTRTLCSMVYAD